MPIVTFGIVDHIQSCIFTKPHYHLYVSYFTSDKFTSVDSACKYITIRDGLSESEQCDAYSTQVEHDVFSISSINVLGSAGALGRETLMFSKVQNANVASDI